MLLGIVITSSLPLILKIIDSEDTMIEFDPLCIVVGSTATPFITTGYENIIGAFIVIVLPGVNGTILSAAITGLSDLLLNIA